MGYRPQSKTFRLTFEEPHEFAGLEMRTRSVPLGTVVGILRAAGAGTGPGGTPAPEDLEAIEAMFDQFGDALIEWNLEHPETGDPVPATPEGLRALDLELVTGLAMAWIEEIMGAAAPKSQSSTGGGNGPSSFPRVSIPMTPRSESTGSGSLPSSLRPSS